AALAVADSPGSEPGVDLVTLTLECDQPAQPPACALSFTQPSADIHATWTPGAGFYKGVRMDWSAPFDAKATSQAPVVCLHGYSGENRLTFACDEVLAPVRLRAGVREETGEFQCEVALFDAPAPAATRYTLTLRLDTRAVPYHIALREVARWWAAQPGNLPLPVPAAGREPMYSTWYSFHQDFTAAELEAEAARARDFGCTAMIVDDGWQTTDAHRGYAYCGDWEVAPARIPDMRAHVDRVHTLGLRYLLWYSVPFIGIHARNFSRFAGKYLYHIDRLQASVLDPRFPEVREFLINTWVDAVRDWDLDGLKLDFVDRFDPSQTSVHAAVDGRDLADVMVAVDRLLSEATARLRAVRADILIEFRQTYIGPRMRHYGNLLRANDCPNDSLRNRVSVLDIRLLADSTATHADMLMWHPSDPVESAALQLLNVLFAVPQISVRLDRVPVDHLAMLRHWLGFWRDWRCVLLDGDLAPLYPEHNYPVVLAASADGRTVAVAYTDAVVPVAAAPAGVLAVV
ncbi:MAG: alpha-galactosidase, partial [Opitutaceae bacterium]|nr:alpha-galactosidase [Opitutaceae bacterium]